MRSVEILAITTEVNIPQPELLEFSSSATIAGQRAVVAVRIHSESESELPCVLLLAFPQAKYTPTLLVEAEGNKELN